MKTILYKTILVGVFLSLYVFIEAQSFHASYSYDNQGNRTEARVIYLSEKESPDPNHRFYKKIKDEMVVDKHTNIPINIYPNPTKGMLIIEIPMAAIEQLEHKENNIKVWNMQGVLLFETDKINHSNTINFSEYANGIYILQIRLYGNKNTYRIIKQ